MKFSYRDKIKITKGFYRGQTGSIMAYWGLAGLFKYCVRLDHPNGLICREEDIYPWQMEKIE